MKLHSNIYRSVLCVLAAIGVLSLGSCANGGLSKNEAYVRIEIQVAGMADNAIEVILPVTPDGTEYMFEVTGYAESATTATFTLDIYRTPDTDPTYTGSFSLPLGDVNAEPGESGYGVSTNVIYAGANSVVIPFVWTAAPPLSGGVDIDLTFHHPPRIIVWSVIPGPGVPSGTDISIQAEVEFYGDSTSETVWAQFWDEDAANWIGDRVSLIFDPAIELWTGTISAEPGSESLWLGAEDSDGLTNSDVDFPVAF